MRRYTMKERRETETIFCNGCGKEIKIKDGVIRASFCRKKMGIFF